MGCAQLHSGIDIFYAGDALRIDADGLVDHGNQNPVHHESGSLLHFHGSLADLHGNALDLLHQLVGGVCACDHQLHPVGRVEEMHADHRTIQSGTDLGDGEGRGVGGEDALGLHDLLKLLEGGLLDLHIFGRNLNHQIAVRADILEAGGDLGGYGVGLLLRKLFLAYQKVQIFQNPCLASVSELLLDVAQAYLIAVRHGKCLSDSGSHGARTDNSYFHSSVLLITCLYYFSFFFMPAHNIANPPAKIQPMQIFNERSIIPVSFAILNTTAAPTKQRIPAIRQNILFFLSIGYLSSNF